MLNQHGVLHIFNIGTDDNHDRHDNTKNGGDV